MRLRLLLAVVSAALLGGAFAIVACGSAETDAGVVADGADAAEGGARDASEPDVADRGPPCDTTRDMLAKVRDAAIGDGASTTGACLGCARTECGEAIDKCTHDCPCQTIVGDALECYLMTQQIGCASELANVFIPKETRKYALELLGCVQSQCPAECAIDGGAGPDDGAAPGDGGSDAGQDADGG